MKAFKKVNGKIEDMRVGFVFFVFLKVFCAGDANDWPDQRKSFDPVDFWFA